MTGGIVLGIRPKSLVSFGFVMALWFIASAIALYPYSRFSNAMGAITQRSVPIMAQAMELTLVNQQASTDISNAAFELSDTATQLQRLVSRFDTDQNDLIPTFKKLPDWVT